MCRIESAVVDNNNYKTRPRRTAVYIYKCGVRVYLGHGRAKPTIEEECVWGVWVAAVARNADAERGRGRSPRCRRNARTSYYNNIRTVRYLNHYNIYTHTRVWRVDTRYDLTTMIRSTHDVRESIYSSLPTDLRIILISSLYRIIISRDDRWTASCPPEDFVCEGERTAQNLSSSYYNSI